MRDRSRVDEQSDTKVSGNSTTTSAPKEASAAIATPEKVLAAKPSPANTNTVPVFRTTRLRAKRIETDPGRPGYDVSRLAALVPPWDIFAQEPRNPKWATAVETTLKSRMEDELLRLAPEIKSVQVECRSTMCRVAFDAPPESERIRSLFKVLYAGPGISSWRPDGLYTSYNGTTFNGVPSGDADALFARLAQLRKMRLEKIHRSGRDFGGVKLAEWPHE
jgi:hypothetical protein